MKNGIGLLPLIPLRSQDSETSEMVTQLLFGETFQIIDENSKWACIKLDDDNYEGWADKKMIFYISGKEYEGLNKGPKIVLSSLFTKVFSDSFQSHFWLPAGSVIRGSEKSLSEFTLAGEKFTYEKPPVIISKSSRKTVIETARNFLNAPYLWGGKTIMGIDCSGFTQTVMKINGINIPRDTKQQVEKGMPVSFITETQAGDLAFFDNDEGQIMHTGIILDKDTIIHASGKVQIDRLDHQGIFNLNLNKYTHKLRTIKRII